LIPSGFAETGNVAGQNELVEIGRKYGVRLMGPNIYGFYYTPAISVRPSARRTTFKGHAALSSQSGGIGMAIIGFSRSAKMGVSAMSGSATSPTSTKTIAHLLRARREHHDSSRPVGISKDAALSPRSRSGLEGITLPIVVFSSCSKKVSKSSSSMSDLLPSPTMADTPILADREKR